MIVRIDANEFLLAAQFLSAITSPNGSKDDCCKSGKLRHRGPTAKFEMNSKREDFKKVMMRRPLKATIIMSKEVCLGSGQEENTSIYY